MSKIRWDMACMVYQGVGGLQAALMDREGYRQFRGGLRVYAFEYKGVVVGLHYQPGIGPTKAKDFAISQLGALIEARAVTMMVS